MHQGSGMGFNSLGAFSSGKTEIACMSVGYEEAAR